MHSTGNNTGQRLWVKFGLYAGHWQNSNWFSVWLIQFWTKKKILWMLLILHHLMPALWDPSWLPTGIKMLVKSHLSPDLPGIVTAFNSLVLPTSFFMSTVNRSIWDRLILLQRKRNVCHAFLSIVKLVLKWDQNSLWLWIFCVSHEAGEDLFFPHDLLAKFLSAAEKLL